MEKLVFRYYYQERLPHDEIVNTLAGKHDMPTTGLDVAYALDKIDSLLSINKRWHLLMALNQNRAMLSIEDLEAVGFEARAHSSDLTDAERERFQRLSSAIDQLDPEDRLLVLLRFEQGMKASEIAQAMAIENHKYVYTRLRTIVNRLRRLMQQV